MNKKAIGQVSPDVWNVIQTAALYSISDTGKLYEYMYVYIGPSL